jgi:UTP--glucose-1-phosphate uridylyltransferase
MTELAHDVAAAGRPGFRSAVVPAAGLGTRFLPTTKTVPKELLPVVDTPGIELVAAEAVEAGAERLLIVTAPGREAVAAHFADSSDLEKTLGERGKDDLVATVRRAHELVAVHTVTQEEPLGVGHAVGCARCALSPDERAFAVLLPGEVVLPSGVLARMASVRERFGGSVLCAFDVPAEEISAYCVVDVSDTDDPDVKLVHGMVDKPAAEHAPSTLAAAGRYLLDVAVFDALDRITPGACGELQLTDALQLLISEGHPVRAVVHRGARHDLGSPGGYVRAFVDVALSRPEYGPELRTWLTARLAE